MKVIKQEVVFNAPARVIYELFTDSKKHSAFTGAPASISKSVGGSFTCYDNYISGEFITLIPNKKIVMKWTCTNFPKEHYSLISFNLDSVEGEKSKLSMVQHNVPDRNFEEISDGWKEHYWDKIKEYLKVDKGKLVKFV